MIGDTPLKLNISIYGATGKWPPLAMILCLALSNLFCWTIYRNNILLFVYLAPLKPTAMKYCVDFFQRMNVQYNTT